MNLLHLTFCDYELPLRAPLHTARGDIDIRRGFLVAIHGESNHIGVGEVAPLPEFSTESHQQARVALTKLANDGIPRTAPDHYREYSRWHASAQLDQDQLPATTFGIDCALAGLSLSLATRGRKSASDPVYFPVNALLQGQTPDDVIGSARYFASQGFTTVKLKAGVLPLGAEIDLVQKLCGELPRLKIRVDANGAWSQAQALDFCSNVQDCGIEYIEDPIAKGDLATLARLRDECRVRVALDDFWSPRELANDRIDWSLVNVLVMKPVRIGSMARLVHIEKLALDHGVDIVYTSMMESSLGIACTMAAMPPPRDSSLAHGLDTARWLEQDTLVEPLISRTGKLRQSRVTDLPKMIREPYRSKLGIR